MTRWIDGDLVHGVEHRLAHGVERVLNRFAVVLGERLEQRIANARQAEPKSMSGSL